MKAVDNAFRQAAIDLQLLTARIATLAADLISFEERVAKYPLEQIKLRLQLIHLQILVKVLEQYGKHGNQGGICIVGKHNGVIDVVWDKDGMILADTIKSWTAPVTILPVEEFYTFIKQLLQCLQRGDWERVVEWLNTNAFWLPGGQPFPCAIQLLQFGGKQHELGLG